MKTQSLTNSQRLAFAMEKTIYNLKNSQPIHQDTIVLIQTSSSLKKALDKSHFPEGDRHIFRAKLNELNIKSESPEEKLRKKALEVLDL
jgi:hypothetical protein